MTSHQIIAAGLLLLGGSILTMTLLSDRVGEATAKAGTEAPAKIVRASTVTEPLVPALAELGPGDPFTQRMTGQIKKATVPLPPPPPVLSPEPPLLPLIGR